MYTIVFKVEIVGACFDLQSRFAFYLIGTWLTWISISICVYIYICCIHDYFQSSIPFMQRWRQRTINIYIFKFEFDSEEMDGTWRNRHIQFQHVRTSSTSSLHHLALCCDALKPTGRWHVWITSNKSQHIAAHFLCTKAGSTSSSATCTTCSTRGMTWEWQSDMKMTGVVCITASVC